MCRKRALTTYFAGGNTGIGKETVRVRMHQLIQRVYSQLSHLTLQRLKGVAEAQRHGVPRSAKQGEGPRRPGGPEEGDGEGGHLSGSRLGPPGFHQEGRGRVPQVGLFPRSGVSLKGPNVRAVTNPVRNASCMSCSTTR